MASSDVRQAEIRDSHVDVRARRADWRSIVIAALAAGGVFWIVDIVGRALVAPTTAWTTPRHIASLLIGERALSPAGSFSFGVVLLALVLHAMISLVYGMLLELAVRRLRLYLAIGIGVLFGCVLYVVNYYLLAGLFTSFADLRGTVALAAHIAFGVTAVVVHAALLRQPSRASSRSAPMTAS